MARRPSPRKTIYDPVHGVISVEGAPLSLIGHPAFQRLWGIRQTGFAHLVFPGANHTRLEHSLGVFWVSGEMAARLGLPPDDARTASVAGLLHDLGHTPFSHTLDSAVAEVLGFEHERISRAWITGVPIPEVAGGPDEDGGPSIAEILERSGVSPRAVADLVDPPAGSGRHRLLRAMLHGAIDADRLDYLQRDAYYTGVAHGTIDSARLLDTVRVHRSRLVFAEKGRNAVEGFLVGRALMYASVYFHKTVQAAETMALSAVERLPGYPEVPHRLFALTDGELSAYLAEASDRSAEIVRRLRDRRLYKRAVAWRAVPPSTRPALLRLARSPRDRRAVEDVLADRLGAPPGTVLVDVSGLLPRGLGEDWSEVGLLEGGAVVHPFRARSVWRDLALRPPSLWPVAVYVDPRWREAGVRRLDALLRRLL